MRVDIIFVIITFAFCSLSLAASVPDLLLSPATTVVNQYYEFFFAPLDAVDDLAFTADAVEMEAIILKRDSNGVYNPFGSIPLANRPVATTTNGKWFGSVYFYGVELFRVDQSGQSYNYSIVETKDFKFLARLLNDSSLIITFPSYIVTYEYDNSEWVVINNSSFPDAHFQIASSFSTSIQNDALVLFDFGIFDNSPIQIHVISHQPDKSWKIIETIDVGTTFTGQALSFFWDGSNTLLGAPTTFVNGDVPDGAVVVFNKINGSWIMSQKFSPADVRVTGNGDLGLSQIIALDNNNVLLAAPADGVRAFAEFAAGKGSVFLMQRNESNGWNFVARFKSNTTGIGSSIAKNGHDALILGCTYNTNFFCSIRSLPTCLTSPIDVTCPQQRDSCDVDLHNLVAVNNPQCGPVTTSYNRITTDKNSIIVDVTLSRLFVPSVNCSSILTCSEASPATTIVSPVATPTATPTENAVSSGQALVNSITLIITALAFIMM